MASLTPDGTICEFGAATMVERIPGFQPPIAQLFGLAGGPFDPHAFRQKCEQFGTFQARYSDDDLWRFSLGGEATLIVGLKTQATGRKKPNGCPEYRLLGVSCAILS